MLSRKIALGTGILLCAAAVPAIAQEAPVSLFGVSIGSPFVTSKDYLFVQEDQDALYYSRRTPSNSEYLLQDVAVSKLSHVVVKVDGRTKSGPASLCNRMLSETIAQLTIRYPKLKTRIDDVAGTAWHLLSFDRNGCALNENVGGMSLHMTCSSSFLLHCDRVTNAFVIEASDTEYSKLARDEAQSVARGPARNHLD